MQVLMKVFAPLMHLFYEEDLLTYAACALCCLLLTVRVCVRSESAALKWAAEQLADADALTRARPFLDWLRTADEDDDDDADDA
jgi:hypothetical protein